MNILETTVIDMVIVTSFRNAVNSVEATFPSSGFCFRIESWEVAVAQRQTLRSSGLDGTSWCHNTILVCNQ